MANPEVKVRAATRRQGIFLLHPGQVHGDGGQDRMTRAEVHVSPIELARLAQLGAKKT